MKLLIVTQVVDSEDPVLGFFHTWIAALAVRFESVVVICLKEGRRNLSANVSVYSLGKEKGSSSGIVYAWRFLSLVWKLRHKYDRVFVHMNQEYILIAGWLWELMNKRVYMWRNHYAGSWLTDLAASTCTKVFCTSKHSYTAKYKKTVLMPVGVDLERFSIDATGSAPRIPHSILFLSRISPSKRPDMLVEALGILKEKGIEFSATIIGSPTLEDESYYEALKSQANALGLNERVTFKPGTPNIETPAAYRTHEIFVNCSPSGMFDKTLFEAAASGCLVLAASRDFADQIGGEMAFAGDIRSLVERLEHFLTLADTERAILLENLDAIAKSNSLSGLARALTQELTHEN